MDCGTRMWFGKLALNTFFTPSTAMKQNNTNFREWWESKEYIWVKCQSMSHEFVLTKGFFSPHIFLFSFIYSDSILYDCVMQLNVCVHWYNVLCTMRSLYHLAHTDHCSPLEFSVVQWLEHPTSVWMVMGSNPICELRIFFFRVPLYTNLSIFI